jgi:hypothetical protein
MRRQEVVNEELYPIDQATAAAALAHAEKAQAIAGNAVRARSSWTSQYLATMGIASVVFLALCGVGGVIAYIASWVAYGVIATWFARREQVSWRGFERLSGRCFAAWFVLQGVACAVGFNFFSGEMTYWVPAALLVSSPFFIGAWRAAHR